MARPGTAGTTPARPSWIGVRHARRFSVPWIVAKSVRTTLKPGESMLVSIYKGIESCQDFLGGARFRTQ